MKGESRQRWLTLLIYIVLILGAAMASRTERNLFSFPKPANPSAFAAVPNGNQEAVDQAEPVGSGLFRNLAAASGVPTRPRHLNATAVGGKPTQLAAIGSGPLPVPDSGTPGTTFDTTLPEATPPEPGPVPGAGEPGAPGDTPDSTPPPAGPPPNTFVPPPPFFGLLVPEPRTWATMILGVFLLGAALRRRRANGGALPA